MFVSKKSPSYLQNSKNMHIYPEDDDSFQEI